MRRLGSKNLSLCSMQKMRSYVPQTCQNYPMHVKKAATDTITFSAACTRQPRQLNNHNNNLWHRHTQSNFIARNHEPKALLSLKFGSLQFVGDENTYNLLSDRLKPHSSGKLHNFCGRCQRVARSIGRLLLYKFCPSVRLSVCNVAAFCENGQRYRFGHYGEQQETDITLWNGTIFDPQPRVFNFVELTKVEQLDASSQNSWKRVFLTAGTTSSC